jgi:hypothetical protein|tara:strand:+ start:164 stop:835 length:672 start_codon:yes stop_codon:yes gene_type:complete
MSYPTLCIDNFLENPDEIVEYSNRLNFIKAEHGRWPGLRVDLSLDPVGPFLMQKISTVIHPHRTEKFSIECQCFFQKINNCYGDMGWVHADYPEELTAIIYLSKNKNCGTSLYKPKSFQSSPMHDNEKRNFYKSLKKPKNYDKYLKENNDQFEETAYFESVYNRLLIFNSNTFHGVRNFNNKENDRLTFIAFIRSITDVNLKNGYLESRKLAPFMFVNDINNS